MEGSIKLIRDRRALALAGALVGVVATVVVAVAPAATEASAAGLTAFSDCDGLRQHLRDHRRALRYSVLEQGGVAEDARIGGESAVAPVASTPGSTTNVQEAGVDEPDIVKSDGETVFAVDGELLYAVDAAGADPSLLDRLALPTGPGHQPYLEGTELLLAGEKLLVISSSYDGRERTVITEVDVSDPAQMRVGATATAEGGYVSARLSGATARVVTSDLPPMTIAEDGNGRALVPRLVLRDRERGERTRRKLVACDDVSHPARFAGAEMLSVLTIDLERGLPAVDADSVLSSGEIVYASPTSLYVASQRWFAGERMTSEVTTEIHRFDTSAPDATEYVASGEVEGYMLSQWSLSEHEGLLRVASTTAPPWIGDDGGGTESESFVTVLATDGDRLREVGSVGGLGRGESIYAVRFIGDTGYVVTFRQVDPLYTLDLSDPSDPRVLGELKIPGYSAYLHPVGPGLLLGVGQAATSDGQTLGVQVSLFDVSDPGAPVRLDRESFGGSSYSEVESDHHAFAYFAEQSLAMVPMTSYAGIDAEFLGAAALRVDAASADPLGRVARLSHGSSYRAQIRRSLLVGDRLLTVSAKGISFHDPATLSELAFVEL